MKKNYIEPQIRVKVMEMDSMICSSITESTGGGAEIKMDDNYPTGDAAQAHSKEFSYSVWDDQE